MEKYISKFAENKKELKESIEIVDWDGEVEVDFTSAAKDLVDSLKSKHLIYTLQLKNSHEKFIAIATGNEKPVIVKILGYYNG
jgi:hypothetical protein